MSMQTKKSKRKSGASSHSSRSGNRSYYDSYDTSHRSTQENAAFERDVIRRRRMRKKQQRRRRQNLFLGAVILVLAIILLVLLSKCASRGQAPAESSPGEISVPSGTLSEQSPSGSGFWPSLFSALSQPSSTPSGTSSSYDFTKPVPETENPVEDNYFQDAIFIGNSRTEGFFLYSGLEGSTSYATQGLNINTVFTRETVKQDDGTKISVIDAMRAKPDFKKVYIMLGLNELGWVSLDQFQEQYGKLVQAVKEIAPDAIIYIESILPVSAAKSSSSTIYNNERIKLFNERIFAVAQAQKVFYVNVGEAVMDENGCLPSDFTPDGIHLQKKACQQWLAYLKSHTVPQEVLDGLASSAPSASPEPSPDASDSPAETVSPSPSSSDEAPPASPTNTPEESPAPSSSDEIQPSSTPSVSPTSNNVPPTVSSGTAA